MVAEWTIYNTVKCCLEFLGVRVINENIAPGN
jgi:hypothetical protein